MNSLSKKLLTKVKAKPTHTAESAAEEEMEDWAAESEVEANLVEPSVENLSKT